MFLQKLLLKVRLFFYRTEGASAIEYAIIVAIMAVGVAAFSNGLNGEFKAILLKLQTLIATPVT